MFVYYDVMRYDTGVTDSLSMSFKLRHVMYLRTNLYIF